MTNRMTYNRYAARIEYDDEDRLFIGQIAGIRDGVGFHAETVDDYIGSCANIGKERQRPISGRMMFRVDPEVRRRPARAAELSGKSLDRWAEEVLDRVAE